MHKLSRAGSDGSGPSQIAEPSVSLYRPIFHETAGPVRPLSIGVHVITTALPARAIEFTSICSGPQFRMEASSVGRGTVDGNWPSRQSGNLEISTALEALS